MAVNTSCSFDRLYRRHHPLHPPCDGPNSNGSQTVVRDDDFRDQGEEDDDKDDFRDQGQEDDDKEEEKRSAGDDVLLHPITPSARPNIRERYSRRVADIMREEYNAFFDGMTPTAQELYKVLRA